ncbi:MAG: ComF family protein [bacterium]
MQLIIDAFLSLIFPPRCEVCQQLQMPVICNDCLMRFKPITAPYCNICAKPLDPLATGGNLCVDCKEELPAFQNCRCAGYYKDELRHSIHLMKYEGIRAIAPKLAQFTIDNIDITGLPIDIIIPVPLHNDRLQMRGFNQSGLIADEIGKLLNIEVDHEIMSRVVNTTPQMQLPAKERKKNIRGAFKVEKSITGKNICILDDVFTTGSTLNECAATAMKADAKNISVITVARAVKDPF